MTSYEPETAPTGRTTVSEVDDLRRPSRTQTDGLAPLGIERDARGRPSRVTHGEGDGARATDLAYGTDGFLAELTDPLGRST